jgi:hypothetical protein
MGQWNSAFSDQVFKGPLRNCMRNRALFLEKERNEEAA